MDKLARMKELVSTLNEWARLYYEEDAPVVADAEYDRLYDELRALEAEEGYSLPNSPTHRVGGAPKGKFEQSKHLLRLYSLDKCQSKEEFYEWCNRIVKTVGYLPTLTCEYKFDGLTLNILYENGKIVKASTRGNGEVGEVVTAQVNTIKKLPKTIEYKGKIEIQGEAFCDFPHSTHTIKLRPNPLKTQETALPAQSETSIPKLRHKEAFRFLHTISVTATKLLKRKRKCANF